MHKQKILIFIAVFLGVLVLLLMQTEGFQDQNTPEWKAYLAAREDSNAVVNKKWDSEIAAAYKAAHTNRTPAAIKYVQQLSKQKSDEFNKMFLDEARKKGFDPNLGIVLTHHSKAPKPISPHPAVKKVQAVAPSESVKNTKGVTPSQASTIPAKTK
jgi:hypothetical protein